MADTTSRPIRDVAFLEATAMVIPNHGHKHSGICVTFISQYGEFMYDRTFPGGSTQEISRDEAETIMAANQANSDPMETKTMKPPICEIAAETSIKTIPVTEDALALCAVKSTLASDLTREETASLMGWCDSQPESLWDALCLQEILNVYRASAKYDSFSGWLDEDRPAAIRAWNLAVISPANIWNEATQ